MKIMCWGGRSKARIMLRMLDEQYNSNHFITGLFDRTLNSLPFKTKEKLENTKTGLFNLINESTHFITCIGMDGYARHKISKKLESFGLKPISLISKFAILDDLDRMGEGLSAMPGAVVHKFSKIGDQCIFNTNSTVDHECTVGNGVHIMGGASVAGDVTIGPYSVVGTNATVLPHLKIGEGSYIGAGAVVTKDIGDYKVVIGAPAKYLRDNKLSVDLSLFDF